MTLQGLSRGEIAADGSGSAGDSDGDGLDQVGTALTDLNLSGAVGVRLRAGTQSLGQLEEQANATPGTLDVAPYTPTGLADSFFDVFVEVDTRNTLGPIGLLHNIDPLHLNRTVSQSPVGKNEVLVLGSPVQLFTESNDPTGIFITSLDVTIDPTLGTIDGQKWLDYDADGEKDRGEPGLNNWVIVALDPLNGDPLAAAVTRSVDLNGDGRINPETEQGIYSLTDLPPRQYVISELMQPDWAQTAPGFEPVNVPSQLGPGAHWFDAFPGYQDGHIDLYALATFDWNLDGLADEEVFLEGNVQVAISPATQSAPGHFDFSAAEIYGLQVSGYSTHGYLGMRAGDGSPDAMAGGPLATLGAFQERSGDPVFVDSFFDVFFQVDVPSLEATLSNNVPVRVTGESERLPLDGHPFFSRNSATLLDGGATPRAALLGIHFALQDPDAVPPPSYVVNLLPGAQGHDFNFANFSAVGYQPPVIASQGDWEIRVNPQSYPGMAAPVGLNYWANSIGVADDAALDHIRQQWFWFRIDGGAERSLDTLKLVSTTAFGNTIQLVYGDVAAGDPIRATINYQVQDNGGRDSLLTEDVTLQSLSGAPVNVQWFEYSDLDADADFGSASDTAALIAGGIGQTGPLGTTANTTVISGLVPSHFQISPASDIVATLIDGSATVLDDVNHLLGPADVTHAFQWSILLPDNTPVAIYTKEKHLVAAEVVLPNPGGSGATGGGGTGGNGGGFVPGQDGAGGGGDGSIDFLGPDAPVLIPRWLDPALAVGYDYRATVNAFASVTLPASFGDNSYTLHLGDGMGGFNVAPDAVLTGGVPYDFGPGGVTHFRILGIEPAAGVDPADALGFPTGLTFVSGGSFAMTQTGIPETVYVDQYARYLEEVNFGSTLGVVENTDMVTWQFGTGHAVAGLIYGLTAFDSFAAAQAVINANQYNGITQIESLPDFGDAASPYPVTLAENGARHISMGPTLGANRDTEADGLHSPNASADDTTGSPDDEDGVTFVASTLLTSTFGPFGGQVLIDIENSGPISNRVDAWVDFNHDGDWSDFGEQILVNRDLGTGNGVRAANFTIPAGTTLDPTFARFRLSTAGGLGPTGQANDGEVEDHLLTFSQMPGVAGLDGSGNLVIQDLITGGKNDTLTLVVAAGNLIISDSASVLQAGTGALQLGSYSVSIPLSSITGNIQVNTLGGDDTLTVNFGGGNITVPVVFNGGTNGAGGDELILQGGSFGSVAHRAVSGSEGSVVLDGNRISYTGLEPVIDNNSAANRTFTFTGGAETITLSDSGMAGKTTIDSTLSESITFTNPTGSLTVYSGTGSDTINVTGLGSGFAATLNIDGNAAGMSVLGTFDYTAGALGGEMDINPNGELVYISGGMGQTGWMRVNASNPSSMSNVILAGGFGGGVAVDPATGRYASTNGSNTLRIYNANDTIFDTETITGLGGSLAAGTGTFGISTQGTDRFQIYSQASGVIVFTSGSTAVGSRVEYNPVTHNYEVRRDGGLNFFTLETSPFTTGTVASDVDVLGVNSVTNRLYGRGPGANQVSVLNGSTHAVVNTISGITDLRDVTVNSLRDRVYIGSDGQVLVYDGGLTTLLETFTLPGGYTIKRMEAAQGTDRLYVIGSKSGSPDRLFSLLAGGDGDIVNINGVTSTTGAVNVAGQRINLNAQVSGSTATLLAGDAITTSIATTAVSAPNISLKSGAGGIGASGSPIVVAGTNLNTTTSGNGDQFLKATGSITIDATGLSAGTGTVELDGGVFILGGANRIDDSTKLNVNGSLFALGTNSETVNKLTLTSGSITGSGSALTSTNTIETRSGSAAVILAGANGLTQTGNGATLLSGANTYSGTTTISQGTLQIATSAALGSSSVTLNDANTGNNNTALLATAGMTITNAITVANQGTGVSTIGTDPSVTGNISVFYDTPITLGKDVTMTSPADASFNRTHYRGGITGTGNVTVTGGGRTIWSTSVSGLNYTNGSADYSFAGNITVTGANSVLQFNSNFASGAQSLATKNIHVDGGTFLMLPYNVDVTINGLSGSGRVHSYSPSGGGSAPALLTVGANGDQVSTFDGIFTDNNATDGASLALTVGGGVLTLSDTSINTHTGVTTIDSGALRLNGSIAAASTVTIINGGLLYGIGTVNGAVIVTNGSSVSTGLSPGTLTVGSADFSAGGTLVLEIPAYGTAGTNYDQLAVIGTLTLGGTSHLLLDLNGLATAGTASAIAAYASRSGTPTDTFTTVEVVNNSAHGFEAIPTYRGTSLDYTFSEVDFGDAPAPYPVTVAENGARHLRTGLTLGGNRDTEANGLHSPNASADDTTGSPDDEDGVTFGTMMVGQLGATATVNVHGAVGKLDAWIDFNGDGSWGGPGEQVFASQNVGIGDNHLTFDVPSYAIAGTTYARFRLSTAGGLGQEGTASDGEVEDYQVTVANPAASSSVFGGQNTISTSANAVASVFAADVDGDGDQDVLSASQFDNKIAWYENDGSENFTAHTISTAANYAFSVFAADVDGDGDLDVLSASLFDNKIAWYENDGSQNFTARTISTAADGAANVLAADVDGDGDLDVLSASFNDDKIAWYENDGSQNFTAHTISTVADGAFGVFAADVDGDGDLDVLSASRNDNKIAWYENDGSQNFMRHTISTAAAFAFSVFAADVDEDGDLDVLSASGLDNKIAWYENDGSQNFTAHTISTAASFAQSVFAADVDGDGDLDVLSASQSGNKIAWYENDGSQNFTAHTISTAVDIAVSVFATDVDGDGDLDVLSASVNDDKIAWYENLDSDYGDAPTPYPTTDAENGARHKAVGPALGANRDLDADGTHSALADFDDTAGSPDDEDGVVFTNVLIPGSAATVTVTASAPGLLDAWVDFNNDGTWTPGEQIFVSTTLVAGPNGLSFPVPAGATLGDQTYARFRFSSAGGLGPTGLALDGEVEDYALGSIHGQKFEDVDGDGQFDDGEGPLSGLAVNLYDSDGNWLLASTITSGTGNYVFSGLPAGRYIVREQVPIGFAQTYPEVLGSIQHLVTLGTGQIAEQVNFGNTVPGSIHGFKFDDRNVNGVYDVLVDTPLSGVQFTLTGTDGLGNVLSRTDTTNSNGEFSFSGLLPSVSGAGFGTGYTVTETVPYGVTTTTPTSYTSNLFSRQELVAFAGQAQIPPPSYSQSKILGSDVVGDDFFGGAVAIDDNVAVVGSYNDNSGQGAAYVYELQAGTWTQVAKLTASDGAAGDNFGVSVSISGGTIVVGARTDDDHGNESGSAYVFERPGSGWVTTSTYAAKLTAADGQAGDYFGYSVSISSDMSTVAIGAALDDDNGNDSGSAYVFVRPGTGWVTTSFYDAKLTASDGSSGELFGISVSVDGNTVAIGSAYDDVSVGDSGSVFIYERPGTGWATTSNFTAKLSASDAGTGDNLGFSVRLSGDTVVAGAPFDASPGNSSGSAYVFVRPGTGWATTNTFNAKLTASDGVGQERFGWSVGISSDTIASGALYDNDNGGFSGSAYLYHRPGTGWATTSNFNKKLLASDGGPGDLFGYAVGISNGTVVVGANNDDDQGSNSGTAYVFAPSVDPRTEVVVGSGLMFGNVALDFGDAPDLTYPTLLASDGPRHVLGSGLVLGNLVDAEVDGQPNDNAIGDDLNGSESYPPGDEDGVVGTSDFFVGQSASASVLITGSGYLDAWIDFNRNGVFDSSEHLGGGTSVPVVDGVNLLNFTIPTDAVPGENFARLRLSSAGGLLPTGLAADGEVEDYQIKIDELDYGDAPDPTYPTLLASDGARHVLGSVLYLGTTIDSELDGEQNATAAGDHDDGILSASTFFVGRSASVEVLVSGSGFISSGYIDAWIDFNHNGSFDSGEHLGGGTSAPVVLGSNTLSFSIPSDAVPGTTFARLRLSSDGGLLPTGVAYTGEVEDYHINIITVDFGDAPDPTYPTLLASDGARHILGSGLFLGTRVDSEVDGQPNSTATGDDIAEPPPPPQDDDPPPPPPPPANGPIPQLDDPPPPPDPPGPVNDEDGVISTTDFIVGGTATVQVRASGSGYLDAWIDFNRNGVFDHPTEHLGSGMSVPVVSGLNTLNFTIPTDAVPTLTYARLRLSSDGGLLPTGLASDGEVEDYQVQLVDLDFGDAPDPAYPTLLASDGARHVLGLGLFLGSSVDKELDGQPNATATGDDLNNDDEDGVTFTSPLIAGSTATVTVIATPPGGKLDAWVDFDNNGSWSASEQIFVSTTLAGGANLLSFSVPSGVQSGQTYARFRLSSAGGLLPTGLAGDGEVEDHRVELIAPPTDISLSNSSVAENAGVNAVIGTLSASDPDDPETFTFSLPTGIGDNAAFNISGTSLRANASFDFETKSSYSITVRVTDSGNNSFDESFTITVTDVVESPTKIVYRILSATAVDVDVFFGAAFTTTHFTNINDALNPLDTELAGFIAPEVVVVYPGTSDLGIIQRPSGGAANREHFFNPLLPDLILPLPTGGAATILKILGGGGGDIFLATGLAPAFTGTVVFQGGLGNDLWIGLSLNVRQRLEGEGGDDLLFAGNGIDTLIGGAGNDFLFGGAGDTVIQTVTGTSSLTSSRSTAPAIPIVAFGGALSVAQQLALSKTARGLPAARLTGAGTDTIQGIGNVVLIGSDGPDVINTSGYSGPVTILAGGGNDTIIGSRFNDLIDGGNGNDVIKGGAGNDLIVGGAGADSLSGQAGNDQLLGDGGNDILSGGLGNDILRGGDDNDTLIGGFGIDTIDGEGGTDTALGGQGRIGAPRFGVSARNFGDTITADIINELFATLFPFE